MNLHLKYKNNTIKSFLKKAFFYILRHLKNFFNEKLDIYLGTEAKNYSLIGKFNYFSLNKMDLGSLDLNTCNYIYNKYLNHDFDLLGSGWKNMNIDKNKNKSLYRNIDWHKDIISGFTFNKKIWYKKISNTSFKGVDIKGPWELGRLQHLPQLAIFAKLNLKKTNEGINEFKNQIIDFDDNNLPRFGVHWSCTMDVAIRVANILAAYDMFKTLDFENVLDDEFHYRISKMVYEHGFHIRNNLEKNDQRRNNHYLSNISGLLIAGLYLDGNKITNEWLHFSLNEIIKETEFQFYDDGGNFESSASYHGLSTELVLFPTLLLFNMSRTRIRQFREYLIKDNLECNYCIKNNKIVLPPSHFIKLKKIGYFLMSISNEHGVSLNYGDNDNGRLYKFSPIGKFIKRDDYIKEYELQKSNVINEDFVWAEDGLNFSTILAIFSKVFNQRPLLNYPRLEYSMFNNIDGVGPLDEGHQVKTHQINKKIENTLPYSFSFIYELNKNSNVSTIAFNDSGVYLIKSDDFLFAIYQTPIGQNGFGGHKHSDSLSCELYFNGKWLLRDPGTYCYTSNPIVRDTYRSYHSHNAPIVNGAEPIFFTSPFGCELNCEADVVCNKNFISIIMKTDDLIVQRVVEFNNGLLSITDKANEPFEYSNFNYVSTSYGRRIRFKN